MVIIGLTGPISHGKTVFSRCISSLDPTSIHFESFQLVAEVANKMHSVLTDIPDAYNVNSLNNWLHALPKILQETVGVECSFKDIELNQSIIEQHPVEYQKLVMHVENLTNDPSLIKHEINFENKENYRPFLQWLGGYLVQKIDSGIWYNEIVRRINQSASAGAELCIVSGLRFPSDAAIMRSVGAIIVGLSRPGHLHSDTLDPTERERQNIKVDCTIFNNGSLADLEKFAVKFLADIKNKTIEKVYHTATL